MEKSKDTTFDGNKLNKAFFWDRDGTINIDYGYVGNVEDVELIEGIGDTIHLLNESGFLVIVVSNQSGVARGYFSMEDVDRVNNRINELLSKYGAHVDKFYICPHLQDGVVPKYTKKCRCRKPQTGLFQEAIAEYHIDVSRSYAVGDKLRDIECLPGIGFNISHLFVVDSTESRSAFFQYINNHLCCIGD